MKITPNRRIGAADGTLREADGHVTTVIAHGSVAEDLAQRLLKYLAVAVPRFLCSIGSSYGRWWDRGPTTWHRRGGFRFVGLMAVDHRKAVS
jgi:hypothetical protein